MRITYDNYEIYALEYLEGVLSAEKKMAFEEFLLAHPDIKEEMTGLGEIYLTPEPDLKYHSKDQLYHIPPKGLMVHLTPRFWVVAATLLLLVTGGSFFIWRNHILSGSATNHLVTNHQEVPDPGSVFVESDSLSNHRKSESLSRDIKGSILAPKSQIRLNPLSSEKQIIVRVLPPPTRKYDTLPVHFDADHSRQEKILTHSENEYSRNRKHKPAAPVSLLPAAVFLVESSDGYRVPELKNTEPISAQVVATYKIHIPGEFLSETWTDLSLNHFKKKLIPEIFKSE